MSPVIVWLIIFALLMALAYYVTRLIGKDQEGSRHDTGLAILEFGRAFPNEAIRSLHVTADAGAIFVRLYGSKAGFMRSRGNHYACHLIAPGRVRIFPLPNAKGFSAEFLDAPTQNGTFVFSTEKEAAEVSLWLLDNYVNIPGLGAGETVEAPADPDASGDGISPDRAK
ncbi:hypothetical protein EDE05_1316 [Neorhizobium sp. R1-B]|uniref:hypothetical protein n=2 Tax=Neorhizobium TaxID=1525371 RepID=UPI0010EAA7E1|nr:hypothetical protein EDE09_124107 [Neorhizobium sp. S3-V5DH]TDX71140.1 hypothetical protein EDE05_1316 [Neorhizobium sp. R1-B]